MATLGSETIQRTAHVIAIMDASSRRTMMHMVIVTACWLHNNFFVLHPQVYVAALFSLSCFYLRYLSLGRLTTTQISCTRRFLFHILDPKQDLPICLGSIARVKSSITALVPDLTDDHFSTLLRMRSSWLHISTMTALRDSNVFDFAANDELVAFTVASTTLRR
jgi:hypothetical protein